MKNKFIYIFVLFTCLAFPRATFADKNFSIAVASIYQISEKGTTTVSQTVRIKNKTEFLYTPSYSLDLNLKDIKNVKVLGSDGAVIPSTVADTSDGKEIMVIFDTRVVGVGKTNSFTIRFDTDNLAHHKGNIWEVSIPGITSPDQFEQYDIALSVPKSFGPAAVIKPYKRVENPTTEYSFTKDEIGGSGIFLLFGQNQYYKAALAYHISNPNLFPVKTEIALPPPTSYQDVVLSQISPQPANVYRDSDGNWLATYTLSSSQKLDINATTLIKLYAQPKSKEENRQKNVLTTSIRYWDAKDPLIRQEAQKLKTPQDIYAYVVKTLHYDYGKVANSNIRLGGREALTHPTSAVCLEFADLFISLARASGFPAREVEGFALTENTKLRPLSLVKDILHAWPEYYDEEKGEWIMVDPTWSNTTHGMDYFSSFDFDHIAFVLKGESSTYPIPAGGYKFSNDSKDIHVTFSSQKEFEDATRSEGSVEARFPAFSLSGFPITGSIRILNTGSVPFEKKDIKIVSDLGPHEIHVTVGDIPPFGNKEYAVSFGKTHLLTNKDYHVTILFDGSSIQRNIHVAIFPNDNIYVLGGGISALGIISGAAYASWRLFVQRRKR